MNSTPGIRFVDKRTLSRDEIMAHIWDRLLAACDDVVGIILFGSFARGETWHGFTTADDLSFEVSRRGL